MRSWAARRMPTLLKLAAFAALIVVAFAAALGLGRVSGVDGSAAVETPPHDDGGGTEAHGDSDAPADRNEDGENGTTASEHGGEHAQPGVTVPDGLQVSANGYTLEVLRYATTPGKEELFEFRIIGPDGQAVTNFTEQHEADLHLIIVRRDLTGYQHIHPEMAADGRWTVPLPFERAGAYRVFADFLPSGHDPLTLGADVAVNGDFESTEAPHPERTVEVDGYTVTADGELTPGQTADLTFTVSRDGEPVTDLQPYLGAAGHLVVLRRGDLAYLHVHPDESGAVGAGPDVGFAAEVPSPGSYALFFEFRHDDAVHTAEFTLEAGAGHGH